MSSTAPSSSGKKFTLRSSDGQTFEVEEAAAQGSQTIKRMIEDGFTDCVIPVSNLTGPILARVVEYLKMHGQPSEGSSDSATSVDLAVSQEQEIQDGDAKSVDADKEQEIQNWDAKFVDVDHDTLLDLTLAAHYLEIQGLLDLTCRTVADILNKRSIKEIRKLFNIKNDFTPQEEAYERSKIQWAFE